MLTITKCFRLTFLLSLVLLITGCEPHISPIKACFVSDNSPDASAAQKFELSAAQISTLSDWFSALDSQWKFEITDHYPMGTLLTLKHRNNRTTRANLRGNELWVNSNYKVLSPTELGALLAIISAENLIPDFRVAPVLPDVPENTSR